jgi:hypothetical protein
MAGGRSPPPAGGGGGWRILGFRVGLGLGDRGCWGRGLHSLLDFPPNAKHKMCCLQ